LYILYEIVETSKFPQELDIEGPADERFDETPETALQAAEAGVSSPQKVGFRNRSFAGC
jgi:hypothetical protein